MARKDRSKPTKLPYPNTYSRVTKDCFDRYIAVAVILLFWWVYVLIAIAIKIDDPKGPVIFKQERLGRNGHVYWMYKFRSMKVGAEHTGSGVYSDDHDDRITKIGHFLRKTSLDELPQIVNMLKGEVSLIGFRSPLTYHPWTWEEYTDEQRKMFALKPGITGWAQVHGRKTVEWHDRIELNCWYAEHVSLWLDIKIFFMTIFKVLQNADNENIGETVKKQ